MLSHGDAADDAASEAEFPLVTPVFDFWHRSHKEHTFHTGKIWGDEERHNLMFYAFSEQVSGTQPVWDFWHEAHKEHTFHFLPAWEGETPCNIQFYAYPEPVEGTSAVWDFWHDGHEEHTFHFLPTWEGERKCNIQFYAYKEVPPNSRLEMPVNVVETLTELIDKRGILCEWLEKLIKDLEGQWAAVSSVKTVCAATAIGGAFAAFFLPPLGVALIAAAGVGSGATTLGDIIGNKVKESNMQHKLQEDAMLTDQVWLNLWLLEKHAERLSDQHGISPSTASALVYGCAIRGTDFCVGGIYIYTSVKDMKELGRLSKNLQDFIGWGFQSWIEGTEAEIAALQTATIASKGLAVLGAVLRVIDCLWSWIGGNPTKAGAEKALQTVKKSLAELQKVKNGFDVVGRDA